MRQIHLPVSTSTTLLDAADGIALLTVAKALDGTLDVVVQELVTPQIVSALGGMVIDIPSIRRELEERSTANAKAAEAMLAQAAMQMEVPFQARCIRSFPADFSRKAAEAARYCDLALALIRPRAEPDALLAEALIFGSGRPVLLVPSGLNALDVRRIGVAWDGSRVSARALGDARALFPGAQIEILVVGDEKRIDTNRTAEGIVAALVRAGCSVKPHTLSGGGASISETLQSGARERDCDILVMGGFGHSRLRDFVLGDATAGVLADLKLPVLMSH